MDTKKLRQKILDLAIRGKLVPQDPNDEPASVLLERIREEKKQMVKEGKLKAKDIKNDTIIFKGEDNLHYEKFQDGTVKSIEDEIPFEVPEGWAWCNLGQLFIHNTGKALNSSKTKGSLYTYITTSNVYWNHFELEDLKKMPFTDEEIEKCTVRKGDLLVCEGGDIGRSAIWDFDETIRIQNHIHRLRSIDRIYTKFYYYVLFFYKSNGKINGQGIGLQGLSSNKLHSIKVPLPPIDEQIRISKVVDKFFNNIENLDIEIKDTLELINLSKAKILDMAIKGELVPQDPNDEPASVLLDRICKEKEELIKQGKLKRDKKESIIYKGDDNSYYEKLSDGTMKCIEDEIPFEIPESWEWARFRNISLLMSGTTYPADKELKTGNCMYVKVADMNLPENEYEITTSSRYINDYNENNLVPTNSVIFPKRGGAILTNKKRLVLKKPILVDLNTMVFTPIQPMKLLFCYYWFLSFDLGELNSGSSVPQINNKDIEPLLIPIPPSEEQVRISTMLEKMFSVISDIEDGIR